MISEAQAQGVILTMDRKNYRDLKSSLLGLSVLACIIPGPQQGGENGEESGNLKLQYFGHLMQRVDSLEKTLGGRRKGG